MQKNNIISFYYKHSDPDLIALDIQRNDHSRSLTIRALLHYILQYPEHVQSAIGSYIALGKQIDKTKEIQTA